VAGGKPLVRESDRAACETEKTTGCAGRRQAGEGLRNRRPVMVVR